jgi:hypothetical protein
MDILIANYQEPRETIRGLARPDCPHRAAFLEGGQNYGKSHLLKYLKPELAQAAKFVVIELDKRRSVPTPMEILTEVGDSLGWQNFPRLDEAKSEFELRRPLQATVSNVHAEGSFINIQAIAQESEDDRYLLATRLTRYFLEDLKVLDQSLKPLILAFDGYDDSTMSLIDRWFDRNLVPRLCELDHVRLIVCGRAVPHTTVKARVSPGRSIDVTLEGVRDLQEWMPIIAALKRRIPGNATNEQVGFLKGLIQAHKGAPGLIMTEIQMFESEE